jgi:hypothetical protein
MRYVMIAIAAMTLLTLVMAYSAIHNPAKLPDPLPFADNYKEIMPK